MPKHANPTLTLDESHSDVARCGLSPNPRDSPHTECTTMEIAAWRPKMPLPFLDLSGATNRTRVVRRRTLHPRKSSNIGALIIRIGF